MPREEGSSKEGREASDLHAWEVKMMERSVEMNDMLG
jgi:hypothetical protein